MRKTRNRISTRFYSHRTRLTNHSRDFMIVAGSLLLMIFISLSLRSTSSLSRDIWRLLFTGNKIDYLAVLAVLGCIALLLVIVLSICYQLDYKRHQRPLIVEDPRVRYGLLHHAKAVFIPRALYYKKRLLLWSGYTGVLLTLLITAAAVQLSRTYAYAPDEFVTTWNIQNASKALSIPSYSLGGYNYDIDWGDSAVDMGVTDAAYHTYASTGVYTVKITGTFPRMLLSPANAPELLTVEQWGTNQWASMASSFENASNLTITATDTPDLSNVTYMDNMFHGASKVNQPLNSWDVSHVTYTNNMFQDASAFNQPLDSWDVSSVTAMDGMFSGASSFNQPLNSWDVSHVTNMGGMFQNASAFDYPLGDWDASNVTDMRGMFWGATSFNQPLNSWNTGSVTNMSRMFLNTPTFNQPLNSWNTGSVTNMALMFSGATSFNQPLNSWDTDAVLSMESMFSGALSFNQPLNSWNTGSVTNMALMFSGATSFNQPLNSWDTSSVVGTGGL